MAERTRLGDVLDQWLQRLRVSKAHVARYGGVSPNTLNYISQGTTTNPETETLRKIARGLATDPHSAALDRVQYEAILRDLFGVTGQTVPSEASVILNFDDELMKRVQDRATAAELGELLDKWPGLSPTRRLMLEAAIRAALED